MKNKVVGAVMLCGVAGAMYGAAYITSYYGSLIAVKIISKYFL